MQPITTRSLNQLSRTVTRVSASQSIRSITSTPYFSAPPKTKPKSSEEPKVKQQKGGNKTKTPSGSQVAAKEAQSAKMQRLLVAALDAPYLGPPPVSEEEMAERYRIGRNYVIGCWEEHNERNHDLAVKIRMKKNAIKMLPKEGQVGDRLIDSNNTEGVEETPGEKVSVYGQWREKALKIDDWNAPPGWRPIPVYTPPIPGFDIEEYINTDDEK
jgi:hypothetical protein